MGLAQNDHATSRGPFGRIGKISKSDCFHIGAKLGTPGDVILSQMQKQPKPIQVMSVRACVDSSKK